MRPLHIIVRVLKNLGKEVGKMSNKGNKCVGIQLNGDILSQKVLNLSLDELRKAEGYMVVESR